MSQFSIIVNELLSNWSLTLGEVVEDRFETLNYDDIDNVETLKELRNRFMSGGQGEFEVNDRVDDLIQMMDFNGDEPEEIWGIYTNELNDFGFRTEFITEEEYDNEVGLIEDRINQLTRQN